MTKTKMNNQPAGPDLESIISGLPFSQKAPNGTQASTPQNPKPESLENPIESSSEGRLWEEFMEILKEADEDTDRGRNKKLYAIDDDIVETLHQCNFDGKPNVDVINSILRAFLIDNIDRLRELYQPRSKSLLDKY